MKKSNLFLVILMALIVMSCSKDETTMGIPQEGNAIEFGTYVGRSAQTRASDITTDVLKGKLDTDHTTWIPGTGFGVFAYYTNEGKYTNTGTPVSAPNFMYNQKVEWNNATSLWEYEPVKYWPNEVGENRDYVSFFAYAPHSAAPSGGNFAFTPAKDGQGDPTITYTVNADAKLQEDLLWGVNNTVANSGAGYGFPFKDLQKQTVGGDIKFQFKHALARIGFNVEAMVDLVNTDGTGTTPDTNTGNGAIADGTEIVVTKVELIGKFYGSGALNLNNTAANVPLWDGVPADPAERTFILSSTADNFVNEDNYGTELNGAVQTHGQLVTNAKAKLNADDSYLMVIPQAFLLPDGIKIRVTYDVITADDKLNTEQSKVTNVITSDKFAFPFVGGNAYTFNLHLGMTSVKFDADVTGWDEQTGTVVNVPINTN